MNHLDSHIKFIDNGAGMTEDELFNHNEVRFSST